MQVYLIADTESRTRALSDQLQALEIASSSKKLARLTHLGRGIYVFLQVTLSRAALGKIDRIAQKGNLVLLVGVHTPVSPDAAGVFVFPDETADDTLSSLIAILLSYKDKEAHFDWITDELTKVNHTLVDETKRLKTTRDELDAKNRKMTDELALASIIQNSFLPKEFPRDLPFNFCHKYIPHEYIGGDFYEIIEVDGGHLGILIADVSGHGVSSALITAMLKSTFVHSAAGCLSPSLVLKRINTEFTRVMRTEHYITAFYSIIDIDRLTMRFAAAGHPRQLVLRRGGTVEAIGANGFFLGMFDSTVYEERTMTLEPGDRLFYYTDGIVECPDHEGNHFGQDNLIRLIERHRDEDIETLSKNLIVELISFMAVPRFPDDVTLLISEVIPLLPSAG